MNNNNLQDIVVHIKTKLQIPYILNHIFSKHNIKLFVVNWIYIYIYWIARCILNNFNYDNDKSCNKHIILYIG